MGVDYYQCAGCTIGFRDDSDYCAWCECGNCFCNVKCGKLENYQVLDELDEDDPRYDDYVNGEHRIDMSKDITCVICRNESYTDYTLLEAVCKHFRITRDQAVNIWRTGKIK